MKRKRGNKKGKSKVAPVISANETSGNKEEVSGLDEYSNNKSDSGMEADTPSSTGTDHHYNLANINPDGSVEKAVGKSVGRVKVKLRTSKVLDSQPTSSDAPTESDTDKSSQHQGFEKQGVNTERTEEESANSLPDVKLSVLSKKAGNIKIKSSKVSGSSSNQTGKALPQSGGHTHPKETNAAKKTPRYNKQELDAALVVIRKVMKMDAAEPFNVPVNPEALGIPDYFDIIDTPMDFGTICSNLERNDKYMNSEDVFKDVQYIWSNCYKYNNKGDYILDLMRRVKKNFMKYWTAAGLYTEQARGTKDDGGQSGEGKSAKGGQTKQKTKKRHGRRHKQDCLCAVCVLKRRRREREENARIAKSNIGSGDDRHAGELKQEESMQAESPGSEDSSSNMDESQGTDGDAEEEKGEEVKTEVGEQFSPSEGKHNDMNIDDGDDEDEDGDDDNDQEEGEEGEEEDVEETEEGIRKKHKGENLKQSHLGDETVVEGEQQEGQASAVQQKKHKESRDKQERAKLFERFCYENPQLSSLCAALFPKSSVSIWSGPNSLNPQRKTVASRTNSISASLQTLM